MTITRPGVFERFRPQLEAELQKRVGKRRSPLHEMLRYHLGWMDEMRMPSSAVSMDRVHGTTCLVAAQAMGGDPANALPAAAAIELARGSVEVLEDVRLGTPQRDGRPALWWVFGHSQGINAGDGLYALARLALIDLSPAIPPQAALQATIAMDKACLELCDRQYADIEATAEAPMTMALYLETVEGVDGGLLGCAARLGAVAAQAPASAGQVLDAFGRKVGTACRIQRDVDTLWGPGASPQVMDVLDKRRSLPLLYAMERGDPGDRARITEVIARRQPVGDPEVEDLVRAIEHAGGRVFATATADGLLKEASEGLAMLQGDLSAIDELRALAEYLAGPRG